MEQLNEQHTILIEAVRKAVAESSGTPEEYAAALAEESAHRAELEARLDGLVAENARARSASREGE